MLNLKTRRVSADESLLELGGGNLPLSIKRYDLV